MGNLKTPNSSSKPFVIGVLVFLLLLLLTQYLSYQRNLLLQSTEIRELTNAANAVRTQLSTALSEGEVAAQSLAFIAEEYGVPADFEGISKKLLRPAGHIDAIELVNREGVITHVYPIKGNEAALGFNILQDSIKNSGAYTALKSKKFFWAGPVELTQGGVGIIGRKPILKKDRFLGFSVVLIRMNTLLRAAGIDTAHAEFHYQLVRTNPLNGEKEFFLPGKLNGEKQYFIPVEIPNGEWTLFVAHKRNTTYYFAVTFSVLGFVLSFIVGAFAFYITKQPYKLNKLVETKTAELAASEKKYRTSLERVSDAFVALGTDWRYSYVNPKAGELFNKDPKRLIGKNIWEEFPEGVGQPFYQAYHKAMQTQQYTYIEEYYPPWNKWFENHIYPSSDGLSIYFKDVTERKKAQEEIMKAYREKDIVLNRITDAMISVNNNAEITFINQTALRRMTSAKGKEITEKDVLRRKVWDVYPGVIQSPFWNLFLQSRDNQEEKELEGFFEPTGNWTVMKMYPSADGVTIFSRDITESKKAQAQILLERNFSDSIINSLPGVFYLFDLKGRYIRWNKNFEAISGYSADEIGSESPPDFFDTDEKKVVLSKVEEAMREGMADAEVNFFTKDKRKIPYYFNGHIINLNGKEYLLGMGIDITVRKKAEAEILLEKNLSESVINSLPGIFYLSDFNGKLIRWNKNFEIVSGYKPEELQVMHVAQFVSAEERAGVLEKKQQAIETGMSDVELNFVTKQGQRVSYYFTSVRSKYNGEPCLLGVGIDITERKKAEWAVVESQEKYRSLIESSPDIIMRLDLEERVQFINYTEGGFTPEQIIGASAYDFVLPEFHELVKEAHRKVMSTRTPQTYETAALGLDGIKRWFYTSVGPIIIQGEVTGITLITRDVTEKKKAEQELFQTTQKLKERVKEQNCLYRISELVNMSETDIKYVLERCVEIIPAGYQYPEQTCARIALNRNVFQTKNFSETPWKQVSEIAIHNRVIGKVEVFYAEEKPIEQEGPFLLEERALINSIAGIIANAVQRRNAEFKIQKSEEDYRYLFNNNPALIMIWDLETLKVLEANEKVFELYGYSREELLNMTVLQYRPAEEHEKIKEFARNMLNSNEPILRATWRHVKKSGEVMYMDISSHRIDYKGRKAILSLAKDITEQLKAEELLKKTYEDIRRLNAHLQTIREEERSTIAREIHDELGQQLTGLKMDAAWVSKKAVNLDSATQDRLNAMLSLIDETIRTVRRISTDLRPGILDDLGLIAALEWQASEFEKRSGIPCKIITTVNEVALEDQVSTGVFRVYQEALTNIMRHAEATAVEVTIHAGNGLLQIAVKDNGKGFDMESIKAKRTLGILGMKERALMFGGQLSIESAKGAGTQIILKVPLLITAHTGI